MGKNDPIYIEVSTRDNLKVTFDLIFESEYFVEGFNFENVKLNDIRNFVDRAYEDKSVLLRSYKSQGRNLSYSLTYNSYSSKDLYSPSITLASIPSDFSVELKPETSELLLEKFSRLLRDNKNKM